MGERWPQVRSIFERAIALEGDAREAWLAEACGDDAELLACNTFAVAQVQPQFDSNPNHRVAPNRSRLHAL